MGGVLRSAEPGLEQSKAGLHEHHEEAGDQGPDEINRQLVVSNILDQFGVCASGVSPSVIQRWFSGTASGVCVGFCRHRPMKVDAAAVVIGGPFRIRGAAGTVIVELSCPGSNPTVRIPKPRSEATTVFLMGFLRENMSKTRGLAQIPRLLWKGDSFDKFSLVVPLSAELSGFRLSTYRAKSSLAWVARKTFIPKF
jgi:hypothetical protein